MIMSHCWLNGGHPSDAIIARHYCSDDVFGRVCSPLGAHVPNTYFVYVFPSSHLFILSYFYYFYEYIKRKNKIKNDFGRRYSDVSAEGHHAEKHVTVIHESDLNK